MTGAHGNLSVGTPSNTEAFDRMICPWCKSSFVPRRIRTCCATHRRVDLPVAATRGQPGRARCGNRAAGKRRSSIHHLRHRERAGGEGRGAVVARRGRTMRVRSINLAGVPIRGADVGFRANTGRSVDPRQMSAYSQEATFGMSASLPGLCQSPTF